MAVTSSSGADTPSNSRPLRITSLRRQRQIQPRIAQAGIIDDELMRAVIGVEIVRQVPQVVHQRVRCALRRALPDDFRERAHALDQLQLLRLDEPAQAASRGATSWVSPRSLSCRITLATRACAY